MARLNSTVRTVAPHQTSTTLTVHAAHVCVCAVKVSLTGGAAASVCTSLPCFQYYKTDIEVYSREGNRVTLSAQPEDAIIGHLYHVTCDDVTAVAPCSCSVHHSVTVTSTGRRLDSRRLLAADSTRRLLAHSIADTTECAVHHCFEGDDGCRHPSAVSPETCLELDASGGCLQAACSLMVHNDYAYDVHIPAAGAAHRGRGLTTVEGSDIWDARASELSVPGGGIEYQAPSESAWTTCRGAAYWLMAKYDVGDLDGDGNAEGINNDDSMKLCGNQELRAKFDRTVNCRELSNSTHCAAEELYEKSCFAQAPLVFFRARCHGVPCNARNAISAADKKKLCLRYHDMVGSCEWDSVRTMCKSCFPARATVLRRQSCAVPCRPSACRLDRVRPWPLNGGAEAPHRCWCERRVPPWIVRATHADARHSVGGFGSGLSLCGQHVRARAWPAPVDAIPRPLQVASAHCLSSRRLCARMGNRYRAGHHPACGCEHNVAACGRGRPSGRQPVRQLVYL